MFVLSLLAVRYPPMLKAGIVLYNSLFFLIVLGGLVAYMSFKNKVFLNPFQNYFGMGDVLFYLAASPLFMLKEYVLFFIGSLIFALFAQIIFINKNHEKTVPLAGFASLFLILIVGADLFLDLKKITLI